MFNAFDTKIDTNMATLKFYLQEKSKQNLYPVMMVYQDKGQKFRFYTKANVKKENWQKNEFKAVSLEDFETKEKFKACKMVIEEIEKEEISIKRKFSVLEVAEKFRELVKKTDPYKENYTSETSIQEIKTEQSEFFTLFDDFIAISKATKAKGTIMHYEGFKKLLIKYEAHSKQKLSFESINNQFYQKFHHYLINIEKMMNNTIGAQIKELKVFLNYAMRNELTTMRYNFKDFKSIKEDIDIISLTENELFRLYECKGLNNYQEIAKDYVCFEVSLPPIPYCKVA